MSCVQLSDLRGVSTWFTPSACAPGRPELSKSYMDMASKYIHLHLHMLHIRRDATTCTHPAPAHTERHNPPKAGVTP